MKVVSRMCALRRIASTAPSDREPDEQRRGKLVAPDQRTMQEVAGDHADEEKPDLEQQDRGRDQRNGDPENLFGSRDP